MARPKKPENETHVNRLSINLTDDDHTFLLQLSARNGIPAGVLGRTLLVSALESLSSTMACSLTDRRAH